MNTQDLHVVIKIAELKSITAAAVSLDMQTATASAALKRVEKQLGIELFIRTTRQLRLSAAGERYIPQCQQALQVLEQAQKNTQDDLTQVEGELRIALSSDLGRNIVVPWLDEFIDKHPKVSLKINISDSNIDFYRDSVDIAIRYGSPKESNLYGFKICNVPALLCASKEYLLAHGTPQHPQQLVQHNGLFYQLHDTTYDVWKFSHEGREYKIKMRGNRASNDGDLVRRWCVNGKGIAIKSSLDIAGDLLAQRVINIMPEYKPRSTQLWLVCPTRQSITPAVRLLRDTLREKSLRRLAELVERGILPDEVLNV